MYPYIRRWQDEIIRAGQKTPAYNIKGRVSARHAFTIVSIFGVSVNMSKIKDREMTIYNALPKADRRRPRTPIL
jgi:hypothetical protein